MKHLRVNTVAAILMSALMAPTLTISTFAQQEVDPTWYDPWAKPTAIHSQQTKPAIGDHKKTVVASTPKPKVKKESRAADARPEVPRTQVALATK